MKHNMPEHIYNELLFTFETIYVKANLKRISERYGFPEKLDIFTTSVAQVLYGEKPISGLVDLLKKDLGISKEVAGYVAIELDQDLFSDVRNEFNVAQGLMSVEDYEKKYAGVKEEITDEANEETVPVPQKAVVSDPVATSILGDNRRPGLQPDPYREPIDEE